MHSFGEFQPRNPLPLNTPMAEATMPVVFNLFRLTDHLVKFVSVRGPPRPSRAKAGPKRDTISIYPAKFLNDLFKSITKKFLFIHPNFRIFPKDHILFYSITQTNLFFLVTS